jgi:hypothetical protein
MSQVRNDVREPAINGASGAFGAKLDAQASLAARAHASPAATDTRPTRSWWARGLRVVRNAAIAVAVMTLVPVGLVAFRGDRLARFIFHGNADIAIRTAYGQDKRPLRVATDPSITPLQAGLALNALQPNRPRVPGFEAIEPATHPIAPWRTTVSLPADMFTTARPDMYNGPSSRYVLQASVKGFSPREMEYLRTLATAPVWREFDLVARARAVDAIGGQLRIPFGAEATPERRPLPSFKDSRELAYAAVARAAYYMAIGQPDTAETVLRSIVSYGFAFIDNGTSGLEVLIGGIIVGTGYEALDRFYLIQHYPRPISHPFVPMKADESRHGLLMRIEDPAVPRGVRFDGLQSLYATSCTNVRELLLGPRADVRGVLQRARSSLARYPSEQALVDLQARRLAPTSDGPPPNPIQSLAVSSATVAGVVLHNPRLASCTRILIWIG